MTLSAGARLGPYAVEAPVGVGGMGEVYRARDTRLDRIVAIKVLRTGAAAGEELRQRFEREARTISSLNHPHICALYDVGQQDGTDFLVMEYLEGETLANRLHRGPLPSEQVLAVGREIAGALEVAHRQRIVHRDLKPANIMLTKAGVKLMDFGLAKLTHSTPAVVAVLSQMTTEDQKLTDQGVIVGTFQYMAPEVLEGKEADARSDLFALGTVLYEMATGRAAFQGKTRASLIAAILSSEPQPMPQLQPLTPPALERVVKACLAKDPDERIQTAHDVLLQLKWIAEAGSEAGVPAPVAGRRKMRERLAWALATVLLVTTVAATIGYVRRAPGPGRAVRFEIGPPANTRFAGAGEFIPHRISPDGRMIAFLGEDVSGQRSLWVRALDATEPRKLDNVETPFGMVWSTDSRTLFWVDESKLRRTDVTGSPPEVVCSVQAGYLTVNREEIFVAFPGEAGPLVRIAANHCAPEEATKLDRSKHFSHGWPFFLPDGRQFLYAALSTDKNHQIWAGSLDSPDATLVLQNASKPVYVEPGYLLFSRHGILMAQAFAWKSMKLSGEAVRLNEAQLVFADFYGGANFSASDTGILAYQLQPELRGQLYWFDRSGRQLAAVTGEPEAFGSDPRLSPDEKTLIVARYDPRTHMSDLWMYHLDHSTWTRMTSTPSPGGKPAVWSPDGSRIVYGATPPAGATMNLYKINSSGGDSELLLETKDQNLPTDWSSDGRFILFEAFGPDGGDLWVVEVASRKAWPLAQGRGDQIQGRFSPDGRWVAYVSNDAGRSEVYLQAVSGGSRIRVSTGGGSLPRWKSDSREIYYLTPDFKAMVADVTPQTPHAVGTPRLLFPLPRSASFEVARDGRFLVQLPIVTHEQERLSVVVNWQAELKQ